jgi:hypothetical protein
MTSRRGLLGMTMVLVALMGTAWAMYNLMHTGTCASGGPYVSAHQCPAGTGLVILGLMGSIFLALGGAAVAGNAALGTLWFGLFFAIGGACAMVAAGGTGGLILGGAFIVVFGIPATIAALAMAGKASSET